MDTEPGSTPRDRGAAVVEFALVMPLFIFIVIGFFEMGFAFQSHLSLEHASRAAAREAAIQRDGNQSNIDILEAVERNVRSVQGEVTRAVIFTVPERDQPMPPECRTASVVGLCSAWQFTDGEIDPYAGLGSGLQPIHRLEGVYIGVYLEMEHTGITGVLRDFTFASTTIEVIEEDILPHV